MKLRKFSIKNKIKPEHFLNIAELNLPPNFQTQKKIKIWFNSEKNEP